MARRPSNAERLKKLIQDLADPEKTLRESRAFRKLEITVYNWMMRNNLLDKKIRRRIFGDILYQSDRKLKEALIFGAITGRRAKTIFSNPQTYKNTFIKIKLHSEKVIKGLEDFDPHSVIEKGHQSLKWLRSIQVKRYIQDVATNLINKAQSIELNKLLNEGNFDKFWLLRNKYVKAALKWIKDAYAALRKGFATPEQKQTIKDYVKANNEFVQYHKETYGVPPDTSNEAILKPVEVELRKVPLLEFKHPKQLQFLPVLIAQNDSGVTVEQTLEPKEITKALIENSLGSSQMEAANLVANVFDESIPIPLAAFAIETVSGISFLDLVEDRIKDTKKKVMEALKGYIVNKEEDLWRVYNGKIVEALHIAAESKQWIMGIRAHQDNPIVRDIMDQTVTRLNEIMRHIRTSYFGYADQSSGIPRFELLGLNQHTAELFDFDRDWVQSKIDAIKQNNAGVEYYLKNKPIDEEGRDLDKKWVTIRGRRVLIKDRWRIEKRNLAMRMIMDAIGKIRGG